MIALAHTGDEAAFERLVGPHRGDVQRICRRMLGSAHDAEDASQEAFLRAWRSFPRFERRSSIQTWLSRIATNVCLDELGRRPEPVMALGDDGPAADDLCPAARYEEREAVELAFVAALEPLPPRQRAAFVLRDVLAFPAKDVARLLAASPASVNSALQRARGTISERLPDHARREELRRVEDDELRDSVSRFMTAFERGEIARV